MSKVRMKCIFEKVFALMFFCVLIVSTLLFPVVAASNIGVHVGSWAKYDVTFEDTWLSELPKPGYLLDAEQRDWNNATVTAIDGSNMTLEVVTHSKNGTKYMNTYKLSLSSGEGNFTFPLLIAANRTVGETVIDNSEAPVVNNTMVMNFAGANRKVNFLYDFYGNVGWNDTSQSYQIVGNGTITYFYYDKETGMLCQFDTLYKELNTSYALIYHWTLVLALTNLWVAEPFGGWLWLLVGATVIIVPVGLYYFSRMRKKKHLRIDQRLKRRRQNHLNCYYSEISV